MKILGFTATSGQRIGIPASKICGFIAVDNASNANCFISTGADNADGGENGWLVKETYEEVWMQIETVELK